MSTLVELQNIINLQKVNTAIGLAIKNRSTFPEFEGTSSLIVESITDLELGNTQAKIAGMFNNQTIYRGETDEHLVLSLQLNVPSFFKKVLSFLMVKKLAGIFLIFLECRFQLDLRSQSEEN